MSPAPTVLDYGRSFAWFTSSRVDHTPRIELAARCTLESDEGMAWVGYLTEPCISEEMYQDSDLIHHPTEHVYFVMVPDTEMLMIKRTVDGTSEARSERPINESMPTHSGVPTRITALGVMLTTLVGSTALTTYDDIRSAVLDGATIVGETSWRSGRATVTVQYPVTTINVAHRRPAWQVDIGLLVAPDPTAVPDDRAMEDSVLGSLRLAALVFNTFDRADLALWPTLGDRGSSKTVSIATRSSLWRVA